MGTNFIEIGIQIKLRGLSSNRTLLKVPSTKRHPFCLDRNVLSTTCQPLCKNSSHNERDGVSNNQPRDCLLNRLFRRRSKKTSTSQASVRRIHQSPVNSPHKWTVTRKMFPFDDVIMRYNFLSIIDQSLFAFLTR